MFRIISKAFLVLGIGATPLFAAAEKPSRIELVENWKLASATEAPSDGSAISIAGYRDSRWHPIHRMPATVLEILQEDGVYSNLYVGTNFLTVPPDLYQQDWWYRTTFKAPAGEFYTLEFPGINYRAEIWLNGERIADNKQIVGMYAAHELNVTPWIKRGARNVLAVKVTPERLIQDVDGVELADSWYDWINWKYLGFKGRKRANTGAGISFVPDRNAGVWKPVYLRVTGAVSVNHALVNSELNLAPWNKIPDAQGGSSAAYSTGQAESTAKLTVFASLRNLSTQAVSGTLKGTISPPGKPTIRFEQSVNNLSAGEDREVQFAPDKFPELAVTNPDLWWPYTMGTPALYDLQLEFVRNETLSDSSHIRFGIRKITPLRDNDESFPDIGKGGNFYLQVNGRDFLVRGGDYTPDLLFRYDPQREGGILRYAKDLGINFLRWESKISSEHIVELADEEGIPLMFGWMCCNQWEKWNQWSEEDRRVAPESLRSQILMLRPHASVFVWANGSDGLPPEAIRKEYHQILSELHWQNATVDTVSSFARGPNGDQMWDGIRMEGPYCWRPPIYWFSGKYPATFGSNVEQGDNEHIPTLESLKKFIPADKLWPINETWFMHAGAWGGNSTLSNIRLAVNQRYGPATNVEDFVRKAQLAHYENTRAQFENFAASGWATHKMVGYWMLNSHWPSFYGNLIDYYLSPGGRLLRREERACVRYPWFSITTRPATTARPESSCSIKHPATCAACAFACAFTIWTARCATIVPQMASRFLSTAQHKSCHCPDILKARRFSSCAASCLTTLENLSWTTTYWQSQKDDDLGARGHDMVMTLRQDKWADMTALNTMPPVAVEMIATQTKIGKESHVTIRLHNPSGHIAFFERASITAKRDGNEILPILYDDNYITVFPGETAEIHGTVQKDTKPRWVRLEGYNTPATAVPIK